MVRNIVLISIDDLRFDAISCETNKTYLKKYGLEGFPHTPSIDSFAERGARFSQAVTVSSYTPPAHASMLTGLYPPKHTIRAFLRNSLPSGIMTVSEILKSQGYRAISAIDLQELFNVLGLNRGYDYSLKASDKELFHFLGEHKGEKLFLFVHFTDVHPPYGLSPCPPSEGYNDDIYKDKESLAERLGIKFELRGESGEVTHNRLIELSNKIRLYCEERAIADVIQFPRYLRGVNKFDGGRFSYFMDNLKRLGMLEDCLLIITSDHGQAPIPQAKMANPKIKQKFDHGETVYDELIRIPLIVYCPTLIPDGRRVDYQVSMVDIAPTVLDYAGIPPRDYHMQGRSLRPLIEGASEEGSDGYSEIWYHDRAELSRYLKQCAKEGKLLPSSYDTFLYQKSLRTPKYKYVETGGELTGEDLSATNAEFVRTLYRKALARVEDSDKVEALVSQLKEGTISRDELASSFTSQNYNRVALYDLENDPFETVNLLTLGISMELVSGQNSFPQIASELKKRMELILGDVAEETSVERTQEEADMEEIKGRLRALGYID